MKKLYYSVTVLLVFITSCNENFQDDFLETLSLADEIYLREPSAKTLQPFAKALYGAMEESSRLREIIKFQAMEQFNKEYDVLYQFIKNEQVEDGLTVRDLLLKHFKSEKILTAIETQHPTLTIHVPQLLEDSFSAEKWNIAEQVPIVAIHPERQYRTILIAKSGVFDEGSDEFALEADLIPAFPVVVLKNNARLVISQNEQSRSEALNNRNSDYVFDFTDDFFDGSIKETAISQNFIGLDNAFAPKIKDAYEIYNNVDGWQRDYVYYSITPTNTKGAITLDYQESIYAFSFSSNNTPQAVLAYLITHSSDPTLINQVSSDGAYPWTSGNFAFRVKTQVGSLLPSANVFDKLFLANPNELFEVSYQKVIISNGIFGTGKKYAYKTILTNFKTKNLNLDLFNWDLANYSPLMKITIEKENPSTQTTTTISTTSQFVSNFGFDAGFGTDVKIGLKFGTSQQQTYNISYKVVNKLENKNLGDVLINFGDKVLIGKIVNPNTGITFYNVREYSSGFYVISVVPRKVQFCGNEGVKISCMTR